MSATAPQGLPAPPGPTLAQATQAAQASGGGIIPAKGKRTKEAIEYRRRQVFELVLLNGTEASVVAGMLQVHRNTVVNDVAEIRRTLKQWAKALDPHEAIGERAAMYRKVAQTALFDASQTESGGAKAMLLAQVLRAMELEGKLLLDTGVIPKAADKVEGRLEVAGGVDINLMSTPELRQLRDQLAGKIHRLLGKN